ncbi:serine protease 133 precursor [Nasonia vitripennis]|uniref:Peptidase S1 domain-containing protein n=1 Tax=Nasonia vitripennis TaxID=7425 RepID=A0A7M6UMD5_NASVI|nr:serine protease 133 precursor [Nasonia vitripennis]
MSLAIAVCLCFGVLAGLSGAKPQTRIIGGETVNIQDYPYQISMRWTYGVPKPMHFCGGSIVSRYHIVTAAHCVDNKRTPDMLRYIKIYTGTSRSDSTGGTGKAHTVKSVLVHPGYTGASTTYLNDIAIVTLREPIDFNQYQKAINLPTQDVHYRQASSAVVTGWGSTRSGSQDTPINLQKAPMRLMTSTQCQRQLPFNLRNSQVCAIQRHGVGVCTGDSGGPLAVNGELVGVASYVVECGKGHPDVYTNVYSYVNFIKKAIASP